MDKKRGKTKKKRIIRTTKANTSEILDNPDILCQLSEIVQSQDSLQKMSMCKLSFSEEEDSIVNCRKCHTIISNENRLRNLFCNCKICENCLSKQIVNNDSFICPFCGRKHTFMLEKTGFVVVNQEHIRIFDEYDRLLNAHCSRKDTITTFLYSQDTQQLAFLSFFLIFRKKQLEVTDREIPIELLIQQFSSDSHYSQDRKWQQGKTGAELNKLFSIQNLKLVNENFIIDQDGMCKDIIVASTIDNVKTAPNGKLFYYFGKDLNSVADLFQKINDNQYVPMLEINPISSTGTPTEVEEPDNTTCKIIEVEDTGIPNNQQKDISPTSYCSCCGKLVNKKQIHDHTKCLPKQNIININAATGRIIEQEATYTQQILNQPITSQFENESIFQVELYNKFIDNFNPNKYTELERKVISQLKYKDFTNKIFEIEEATEELDELLRRMHSQDNKQGDGMSTQNKPDEILEIDLLNRAGNMNNNNRFGFSMYQDGRMDKFHFCGICHPEWKEQVIYEKSTSLIITDEYHYATHRCINEKLFLCLNCSLDHKLLYDKHKLEAVLSAANLAIISPMNDELIDKRNQLIRLKVGEEYDNVIGTYMTAVDLFFTHLLTEGDESDEEPAENDTIIT